MRSAGVRVHHHLAIAVIGGDDDGATGRLQRLERAAKAGIDRLAGTDRGVQIAGMADHVGIGEIHHDQVVAVTDRGDEAFGDLRGRHLGLEVIGGDVRRLRHVPVLACSGSSIPPLRKKVT